MNCPYCTVLHKQHEGIHDSDVDPQALATSVFFRLRILGVCRM